MSSRDDFCEEPTEAPTLTRRFVEAVEYAVTVHDGDLRKDTKIPYVSHLLAVCATVLEHGGDEDAAIGALLHDVAEDHGGEERLADVRERFGPHVAAIVEGCSDSLEPEGVEKAPWLERKERSLAHLRELEDDATLLVAAADKLHNVRSIVADQHQVGDEAFARFNPARDAGLVEGKRKVLWYHEEIVAALRGKISASLWGLLDDATEEMKEHPAESTIECLRRTLPG